MIPTQKNMPTHSPSFNRWAIGPRAEVSEYLPIIQKRRPTVTLSLPSERSERGGEPERGPASSSTPHHIPPASLSRRGVSLLEVLIAIFVLTFGLLSVAMIIPAGRALMVDASKNDRGTACGRAAINDVQVRRWYDSSRWVHKWLNATGTSTIKAARVPAFGGGTGLLYGETYLLDPYFFAYRLGATDPNAAEESVRHFPYSIHPYLEFGLANRVWPDRARARRVTFAQPGWSMTAPPINPLQEPFAQQLTTWADELVFSLEAEDVRPRQTFTWTDGQGWSAPVMPADEATLTATDYALRSADLGRFTWAVMITPVVPYKGPDDDDGTYQDTWDHDVDSNVTTPGVPLVDPTLIACYEISVIVFYNRSLDCPTAGGANDQLETLTDLNIVRERSCYARLDGGGVGGGDVLLFVTDGDNARPAGYLEDIRRGDWIMLKALDRSRGVITRNIGDTNQLVTRPTVCKWYRVIAVDDIQSGLQINNPASEPIDGSALLDGRGRYVSLVGPDWQIDTTSDVDDKDASGTYRASISRFNPVADIAEAAIVRDVVGVYTTIIDVNSL